MVRKANEHLIRVKENNKLRVGIFCKLDSNEWLGGISYFRNLLNAVFSNPDRTIEPVIVTGSNYRSDLLEDFPKVALIATPLLNRKSIFCIMRRLLRRLLKHDYLLESFLVRNHITIVTHNEWIGEHSRIKVLGWISDFQHRYLPEFYSSKLLKSRFRRDREICKYSNAVIVSSNTAAQDLRRFHPKYSSKCNVLRFVGPSLDTSKFACVDALEKTYCFHDKFFYLPNQFWAHKNHIVVLKALLEIKKQGKATLVVASGKPYDERAPEHYNNLQYFIKTNGIQNQINLLGVIPYQDVLSLMAHCIAVINPSLFEGWSTTVEEAKSLGKQLILSKIDVHQEQAAGNALYFNPHNPLELANILLSVWSSFDYNTNLAKVHQSILRQPEQRISYARRYEEIVNKMYFH
jgi:hypothetical protein